MESTAFTVDAALLRELGDRLIGRSYIALAELVKNSYDADATTCRIEFSADTITVSDNGHGISEREFHERWMRIGTTHKSDEKTSRRLRRPMTGSKGLGRLSVQFLADEMTLESTSADETSRSLYAFIDWTGIRRGEGIDTFSVLWDMQPGEREYPGNRNTGTRIILNGLRSTWDTAEIGNLGRHIWMLQSPFRRSSSRSVSGTAQDFYVDVHAPGIERAKEAFGQFQNALFDNWKARIHGAVIDGRSEESRATVSVQFKAGYPERVEAPHSFREDVTLPVGPSQTGEPAIDRANFEILIFKPERRQPGGISVKDMRQYLHDFGNVSVYDGGFRLPYYGAEHDWLNIATDQGRRLVVSTLLPSTLHIRERYLLDLPAPGRIFGSVEIDTTHERSVADRHKAEPGACLQISPGRDRLADNSAFDQLHDLVRWSLDFYANRYCLLRVQAAEKTPAKEPPSRTYDRAIAILNDNREELPAAAYRDVRREIVAARTVAAAQEDVIDRRAEMLAPLATAGMTALALNHELARETRFLARTGDKLRAIAAASQAADLLEIAEAIVEASRRFHALQELFAPLLSNEDLEATDRLLVRSVVLQVVRAIAPLMPGINFDLARIPRQLRFPRGSFSDWNAILQNLLSNAWNAMLDSNKSSISFDGGRGRRAREWLRVSDTGVGLDVPLDDSERLFEPFQRRLRISEENRSIAMGGQGLGLAIVRMIAQRRSVRTAFVQPKRGFSTTVEIFWTGAPE